MNLAQFPSPFHYDHRDESGWGAERVRRGNRPADLKARQTLITWVFIELTLVARTRPLDHFSSMRVPIVGDINQDKAPEDSESYRGAVLLFFSGEREESLPSLF